MKAEISPEQMRALRAYADRHGSRWKARLAKEWASSSAGPVLQTIRNQHGPRWLAGFKFPPKAKGGIAFKKARGRKGVSRAGKVSMGAGMGAVKAALNAIESRVDKLEHNDAATYGLLLGMANQSRAHHGRGMISSLPGFVTPRLYRGGLGMSPASKALGSGKGSAPKRRRRKPLRVTVRQLGPGY